MTLRGLLSVAAILGVPAIGLTLWSWGQPLICTCGTVRLWVNSIWSSGNSQHIADWYTLSHIVHGLLIPLVGRTVLPRLGWTWLFAAAIVTGVGWEIVEHTDMVLDRFRAETLYQGYLGDSVLNAVCDYVFMMGGFFAASALRPLATLALIVALELTSALIARDSLTLTTLSLVLPLPALETWQQQINPNAPAGAD